ncbi:FK506-binding protein 2 precursor, putative, partial [Entamoeba invadens IP1]
MAAFVFFTFLALSLGNRFYRKSDDAVYSTVTDAESTHNTLEVVFRHKTKCSDPVNMGDLISVHYNGTLEDGIMFDTTSIKDEPFSFQIGAKKVIPGWEQGLLGTCANDEVTLTIPPHLGYGGQTVGMIPANSVLKFDIKVVSVVKYADLRKQQMEHPEEFTKT